jgi:hypothetical protein
MITNPARVASRRDYGERLDITEIAKRVRADIRAAQGNGSLPANLEVSVTTSRYSMGRSLQVNVTSVDVPVVNPEWVRLGRSSYYDNAADQRNRLNEAGETILANIDTIVRRYHEDRSDFQADIYDVNFSWSGAGFASEVLHQQEQSLFPADARERPQVFVDYYLSESLTEALAGERRRAKKAPGGSRWERGSVWAYTDGARSYVARAPTKYLEPISLPVPDLSHQASVLVEPYTTGDLREAYEVALSLFQSEQRPNPSRARGARRNGARGKARGRR